MMLEEAWVSHVAMPFGIFLDNEPKSVQRHRRILTDMQIDSVVVSGIGELKTLLESTINPVLFLDMHMPDLYDFREVGMKSVKTQRGENVGIAVIKALLPSVDRADVPAFVLSGFELSSEADTELKSLIKRGMPVNYLEKKNISKFHEAVQSAILDDRLRSEIENFLAAEKIVGEWAGQGSALFSHPFGYSDDSNIEWGVRRSGILLDMTNDIKDRVAIILHIKERLASLFSLDDLELEINWLKEKDIHLPNEASPWDCIFGGSQHELATVAGLLSRIVG